MANLKVYYKANDKKEEELLAIFNETTLGFITTNLYLPSTAMKSRLVFDFSGFSSGNVILDDIRVICYNNAEAFSIGNFVYVDTEFNFSSSFLKIAVSEKQCAGLPAITEDDQKIVTPAKMVSCPAGGILEGEPDCYTDYLDTINSGCNNLPNRFTELNSCNGVICGKSGNYTFLGAPNRDVDCYRLTLNAGTTLSLKVVADFKVRIFINYLIDCDVSLIPLTPVGYALAGDTAELTYNATTPYNIVFYVTAYTPQPGGVSVPCGSNYVMIYNTYSSIITPVPPIAASNPACAPTVLNPMASVGGYSFFWQGNSCGISTSSNAVLNSYPVLSSGNYYVRAKSNLLGCWTPCSSVNVAINQPPVVNANAFPLSVCAGGQAQLTANGATSYVWMPGNLTGGQINVNPASTTTYTVTGTLAGCTASTTASVIANPYPAAAGGISGPLAVCAGANGISYNVSPIADATSYIWAYSGTGATINGSGNTISINFASNATSGTLTVKGHNSCGDGNVSAGYIITVKPLPNVSASAIPSTVCVGSPASLTGIGNATSYNWQPGNLNGASVSVSPLSNTIYTVTGDLNGCTASNTVTVSTNPFPADAGNISGVQTVCAGVNGIAYSVPAITDATSYIWAFSGTGATINGNGNSMVINFASNATSGILTVKGHNSCGDGNVSAGYIITVKPLPTVSASAIPSTVCVGSPASLTGIGNATSYNWQPGNLNGASVSVSPGSNTIYTVTGDLNGCTASNTVTVSTNPYPVAAGNITGTPSVCEGANGILYSVPLIADAISYEWSYSGTGASISGSGNSVIIDFASNATSGILTVKGNNDCGFGAISSGYPVAVNPLPLVSASALPSYICDGQTSVLTASGNATLYIWQPGNLSGSPQNVTPSSTTVFTVTGNLLGCTDTSSVIITVDPCTGISETSISDNIKIGPIPAHDQLLIECKINTDLVVSLFTVEGKLLSVQQCIADKTYFVSTTNLAAAVYFLRIKSDNEIRTFKIVKQ